MPKKFYSNSWWRSHELQEERNQAVRLATGKDPDEHTIYNVLCPAIRAGWTAKEELSRRVEGRRMQAEFQTIKHVRTKEKSAI